MKHYNQDYVHVQEKTYYAEETTRKKIIGEH